MAYRAWQAGVGRACRGCPLYGRPMTTPRTALVTGAAGGIGRALAQRLAAESYTLALADRDVVGLDAVAAELRAAGATVTTHVIDLLDRDAPERLHASVVAAHPALHLLINNAGLTVLGPLEHQTRDDVERVLVVDLVAVAQLCRVFTPTLIASAPSDIVNVSSFAGVVPFPLQTTYCAAKHGVRGLTGGLRIELADRGVRVHAILPGTIATNLMGTAQNYDTGLAGGLQGLMVKYGAHPSAVARAMMRAIRWNRAEVIVGWDAHLGILTFRWAPWLIRAGFNLVWAPFRRSRAAKVG